ncbi:amino acid-binding protein [Paludibaculum fermentans]|uniref:amino acid-binding protein n=1 Tax=Paludibaculum fermentans TaxID=1473598 RepID=UPI003EBFB716
MKIQQLSIFSENKPGHLIAPCRLLAREGINMQAMSLADSQRFGILRVVVSDWQRAKSLLEAEGFVVRVTEVVAVEVPDRPGGLSSVLDLFEGSTINIEYMYAFPFVHAGKAALIFRFDHPDAAIEKLRAGGMNVLDSAALNDR